MEPAPAPPAGAEARADDEGPPQLLDELPRALAFPGDVQSQHMQLLLGRVSDLEQAALVLAVPKRNQGMHVNKP